MFQGVKYFVFLFSMLGILTGTVGKSVKVIKEIIEYVAEDMQEENETEDLEEKETDGLLVSLHYKYNIVSPFNSTTIDSYQFAELAMFQNIQYPPPKEVYI